MHTGFPEQDNQVHFSKSFGNQSLVDICQQEHQQKPSFAEKIIRPTCSLLKQFCLSELPHKTSTVAGNNHNCLGNQTSSYWESEWHPLDESGPYFILYVAQKGNEHRAYWFSACTCTLDARICLVRQDSSFIYEIRSAHSRCCRMNRVARHNNFQQ